ncbi:MAG: hypothetical protein FWG31_06010 [Oscillospiraceae bacterium]|nr:hypothetical protein [Oscillospiraceae bacterium]
MEEFFQIIQDNAPPCFEGIRDIREGLLDCRRGIKALHRGLDDIRVCHVRDGVHDLRIGMRDVAEGINDIAEGLGGLRIDKDCREYCEIQRDIRQMIEGLADIEDGIADVEQRNRCECEHFHVCENGRREQRLRDRENRRFYEGIRDIQEGIRDIETGFYDLSDDLRELFYIPGERREPYVRYPMNGRPMNGCNLPIQPLKEESPFRKIRTVYFPS